MPAESESWIKTPAPIAPTKYEKNVQMYLDFHVSQSGSALCKAS